MEADSDLNDKRKLSKEVHAQHIETAQKCKKDRKWEGTVIVTSEAGNAYFEAAKVAENELVEHGVFSRNYRSSAICYHISRSKRAYEACHKTIEAHLKDEAINDAIHMSVMSGYQYETDCEDFLISNEFYNKAEDLRVNYNLKHSCELTHENMQGFIVDVSEELDKNPKNSLRIINSKSKVVHKAGICRKCVYFWIEFFEYFKGIRKLVNQYPNYNYYRGNIDSLKEYHEKFKEKLTQTIAYVEKLSERRKRVVTDNDRSEQPKDA
ncbi:hypothetical protein RF11_14648 [Thelohanellus kitauei]|uniref:Uncharacterized protein n=1 Tax=Thelohanellus kitauei TaxID=669202 RepID=A0A0C2IFA9_THEKT|nr:hypothetical protein RF11_14648 [Thelohanellus kitauei]